MNAVELADCFRQPPIAVVSTTKRDGSPHAVPVWYRHDGERPLIWTARDRA